MYQAELEIQVLRWNFEKRGADPGPEDVATLSMKNHETAMISYIA